MVRPFFGETTSRRKKKPRALFLQPLRDVPFRKTVNGQTIFFRQFFPNSIYIPHIDGFFSVKKIRQKICIFQAQYLRRVAERGRARAHQKNSPSQVTGQRRRGRKRALISIVDGRAIELPKKLSLPLFGCGHISPTTFLVPIVYCCCLHTRSGEPSGRSHYVMGV